MSADLIAFLKARLDEQDHAALRATESPWEVVHMRDQTFGVWSIGNGFSGEDDLLANVNVKPDAVHIALHDPKRVLADVAAKRQIIDRYEYVQSDPEIHDDGEYAMAGVLRLLALPFSGHPDYQESWKP